MSLRADNITQLSKTKEIFSDFLTDFGKHPITKELSKVKNENAIKQSIRNLINTNYGERFYRPTLGCNVKRILFEPNDVIAAEDLQFYIETTLTQHEKRIILHGIDVYTRDDSLIAKIVFSIVNSSIIQTIDVLIRRVR